MKNKKFKITLTAVVMVAVLLVACGKKEDKPVKDNASPTNTITTNDVTNSPTEEVMNTPTPTVVPDEEVITFSVDGSDVIMNVNTDIITEKDGQKVVVVNDVEITVDIREDGSVIVTDETIKALVLEQSGVDEPETTPEEKPEETPVPTKETVEATPTPTNNPTKEVTENTATPTKIVSKVTLTPTPVRVTPTPTPTKKPTVTIVIGKDDEGNINAVTPTPTPKPTATNTPTTRPTNTPTSTPTSTPTLKPTATNTPRPTVTNTPTTRPTNTPTSTPTSTPKPTATNTPKPTATNTPVPTRVITNTPTTRPTNTPTPTRKPTNTPTPKPTATNTPRPTATPVPTKTVEEYIILVPRGVTGKDAMVSNRGTIYYYYCHNKDGSPNYDYIVKQSKGTWTKNDIKNALADGFILADIFISVAADINESYGNANILYVGYDEIRVKKEWMRPNGNGWMYSLDGYAYRTAHSIIGEVYSDGTIKYTSTERARDWTYEEAWNYNSPRGSGKLP